MCSVYSTYLRYITLPVCSWFLEALSIIWLKAVQKLVCKLRKWYFHKNASHFAVAFWVIHTLRKHIFRLFQPPSPISKCKISTYWKMGQICYFLTPPPPATSAYVIYEWYLLSLIWAVIPGKLTNFSFKWFMIFRWTPTFKTPENALELGFDFEFPCKVEIF